MLKISEYLSEIERAEIEKFVGNVVLKEAVRKVLLAPIYQYGTLQAGVPANPLSNFAIGLVAKFPTIENEKLGQNLKAQWEGMNLLESGFAELEKFKRTDEEVKLDVNEAR